MQIPEYSFIAEADLATSDEQARANYTALANTPLTRDDAARMLESLSIKPPSHMLTPEPHFIVDVGASYCEYVTKTKSTKLFGVKWGDIKSSIRTLQLPPEAFEFVSDTGTPCYIKLATKEYAYLGDGDQGSIIHRKTGIITPVTGVRVINRDHYARARVVRRD